MDIRKAASVFACALGVIVLISSSALALHGGAASPDGAWFVVGGDNRAIYVYDTKTWEIAKRIWIGSRVRQVHFTPDGSQCVVLDDHGVARIYNPKDWTKAREMPGMRAFAMARNAPVAVASGRKKGGRWDEYVVKVLSVPGWEVTGEIPLEKGRTLVATAITADGKTAYARTRGFKDDTEKQKDPGPEPKGWTAKGLWRMRKDGQVSELLVIDVAKKAIAKKIVCYDTPTNCRLYPVPQGAVSVVYGQYCGWLNAATGEYTTQITKQFAYGSGQDRAGNLYIGSLRSYLVLTPNGKPLAKKQASKLPGFPEYFRGFAPLGSDLVVGVTDAFRLILIDARQHTVVKEIACY